MTYVVIVILAVVLGWGVLTYNRLVRLRVRSEASWRDIDTQLKRRWDLIPSLVEVVKGYAAHEQETFQKVTAARTRAVDAPNLREQAHAEDALKSALRALYFVAEDYPQLKANENFLELSQALEEVEDAVQRSRRYYNAVVRDLNNAVETFPSRIIARWFRFGTREYYLLPGEEGREPPRVGWR
ncbi:MAG: LemA family protein [Candidatus Bipolaricaulota bacterium]|nr:MAG: LemA family protein [Candidatus Bipolaricaulota bacterium]